MVTKLNARERFGSVGNRQQGDERVQTKSTTAAAAPMLDLQAAVIEIRSILSADIAALKRTQHSDGARGVLLRRVQQTSDSLCRLERTFAELRREKKDALPWTVFEEGISQILDRLVDIRRGMPSRVMAEIETRYNHRVARVVRLISGPLSEAITKVCEQDVLVLVQCSELRPVYEHYRQRARELEAADHAKP